MVDTKLITFLKLCETKNYTKTAENLFITQPAVTHHIKMLEKMYDIKLFVPNDKNFHLTEQGEILFQYAKKTIEYDKQFERAIEATKKNYTNARFAVTNSIMDAYLAPVIEKWSVNSPSDKICITVSKMDEILESLDSGELDFAIVDGNYSKQNYDHIVLTSNLIYIVAGKKHQVGIKKRLDLDKILEERWFLDVNGTAIRDTFTQELQKKNITISQAAKLVEVNDESLIKKFVKTSQGLSVFYEDYVKNEILKGDLIPIEIPQLSMRKEFSVIFLKNHLQKAKIKKIVEEIIRIKASLK